MKFQIHLRLIVCLGFYLLGYGLMTRPVAMVGAAPGDLDTTFGVDYAADGTLDGYYLSDATRGNNAYDLLLNSSGNIFIVGGVEGCSAELSSLTAPNGLLSEFSSNGALNTTLGTEGAILFDYDTTVTSDKTIFKAVQQDSASNIFAIGYNKNNGSDKNLVIAKFDSTGTNDGAYHFAAIYDSTFGDDVGYDLAIDSSANVIAVGETTASTLDADMLLIKFDSDGAKVTSFGSSATGVVDYPFSSSDDGLNALALDYDDDGLDYDIVTVGYTTDMTTSKTDIAILRFNSDGSLDVTDSTTGHTGFDTDGYLSKDIAAGDDEATDVVLDSAGNIFVTGFVTTAEGDTNAFVAKYSSTGAVDATFGTDGYAFIDSGLGNDKAYSLVLDSKGSVLLSGRMGSSETDAFFVARLTSSGVLDTTFGEVSGDAHLGYSRLDLSESENHQEKQNFQALQLDASENIIAVGAIEWPADIVSEPSFEKVVLAKFEGGYVAAAAVCGNGTVETDEECDDTNVVDGDGCSATCQDEEATAECGNGALDTGEECDPSPGDLTDGDGCSSTCTIETDSDGDGYFGSKDCNDSDASVHENCADPSESEGGGGAGCGCVISKRNPNTFEAGLYGMTILSMALLRLHRKITHPTR